MSEERNTREILTRPPVAADARIFYGDAPCQFGELRVPNGGGGTVPGSAERMPVVVVVHGGCWRSVHTLDYASHIAADLASHGVVTWSLEYRRLSDEGGGWPGTFLDIANGVDHLRLLADRYRLDLGRVVVTGHSAGGHLALWAAGRGRLPVESPLRTVDPLPLAGVVPIAGVTDLSQMGTACDDEVPRLLGLDGIIGQASPIEMLPLGLPVTIIHGDADQSVPGSQSISYAAAAEARGDHPRLIILPGADHFVVVDPRTPQWATVRAEILALAGL